MTLPSSRIAAAAPTSSSAPAHRAVLRLAGGEVTYANGVAGLRGIDLEIRRGQFLVLLGPSGAGKSSLLRCLNGLVPLTGGRVFADGIGAVESPQAWRAHRRRTAMVFQQHHLIGRLHALDNVLTGRLGFHSTWRTFMPFGRADKLIALEALARVGMADQALQRADQISGGQQQRVGIARALAQQPHLLLADEPVASLDPATAIHVLELMHSICRAGDIAAAVSLHQVELAQRFADRVVGIAHGRVVFDGPPQRLDAAALQAIYGRGFESAPAALAA